MSALAYRAKDGTTFLFVARWYLPVTLRCLQNEPELMRALEFAGWAEFYVAPYSGVAFYAPRRVARLVRWVLRVRDTAVRSWGQHIFDLGLLREGERVQVWPRWLLWEPRSW